MSELIITPNLEKKTARIRGKIAAGEHIKIVLKDCASLQTNNLRFRIMNKKEMIALFPLEDNDEYTVVGNDLTFTLNLNTISAISAIRHFGERAFLFILDDASENIRNLYFSEVHEISKWCLQEGSDVPISLDTYRDDMSKMQDDVEALHNTVEEIYNSYMTLYWDIIGNVFTRSIASTQSMANSANKNTTNHINNKSNPHLVTKVHVGLGNVDNTSDIDKPISYLQQQALNEIRADITELNSTIDNLRTYLDNKLLDKSNVSHTHSQYALMSNVTNEISSLSSAIQQCATKAELNNLMLGIGSNQVKDRNFSLSTVRDISSALTEVIRAMGGNVL